MQCLHQRQWDRCDTCVVCMDQREQLLPTTKATASPVWGCGMVLPIDNGYTHTHTHTHTTHTHTHTHSSYNLCRQHYTQVMSQFGSPAGNTQPPSKSGLPSASLYTLQVPETVSTKIHSAKNYHCELATNVPGNTDCLCLYSGALSHNTIWCPQIQLFGSMTV